MYRGAAYGRASRLRPVRCAARPRRYARRWFARSSARRGQARGRCRRSRYRAVRGRSGRAAALTASAARRACRQRRGAAPSFGLETWSARLGATGAVAETGDEMVVDHARRLHEGINNGGADKFETAARQFLGYLDRDRRGGRHARRGLELVHLRPAVDEIPKKLRKARAFVHDLQIGFSAFDRALDLRPVTDDADIVHQRMDFLGVVARDLFRPEIVEGTAEIVALAQDGDPGQAGLEAIEDQLLIKRAVVVFRHTPFGVVVCDVDRVLPRPGAADLAVGMQARGAAHATVCLVAAWTAPGSARRMPSPPAVSVTPA